MELNLIIIYHLNFKVNFTVCFHFNYFRLYYFHSNYFRLSYWKVNSRFPYFLRYFNCLKLSFLIRQPSQMSIHHRLYELAQFNQKFSSKGGLILIVGFLFHFGDNLFLELYAIFITQYFLSKHFIFFLIAITLP